MFKSRLSTLSNIWNVVTGKVDPYSGFTSKTKGQIYNSLASKSWKEVSKGTEKLELNLKELNNNNIPYLKVMTGIGAASATATLGGIIAPTLLPWSLAGVPATLALKNYGLTYAGFQMYKSPSALSEIASIPFNLFKTAAYKTNSNLYQTKRLIEMDPQDNQDITKDVQNIFAAPYQNDGFILKTSETDDTSLIGSVNVNDPIFEIPE